MARLQFFRFSSEKYYIADVAWQIITYYRLFGMSSEIFGYGRVFFENPGTSGIKISRLWLGKIWQVY